MPSIHPLPRQSQRTTVLLVVAVVAVVLVSPHLVIKRYLSLPLILIVQAYPLLDKPHHGLLLATVTVHSFPQANYHLWSQGPRFLSFSPHSIPLSPSFDDVPVLLPHTIQTG